MKLLPVKNYREPEYPTQENLRTDPEFLRGVPRRWRGNRAVLGALAGALALMNQSCTTPPWGRTMGMIAVPRSAVPEDEGKAVHEQTVKAASKPEWAPIPGRIAVPRSAVPEDEARAAHDQAAQFPTK